MLAQQTAINTSIPELDIAELADRYTPVCCRPSAAATDSLQKNATTLPNPPGWPCVNTPSTSATRDASQDGWPRPCAGSAPQPSDADTSNNPPPTF